MRRPNRNLLRGAAGGLRPSLNTSLPKIPGVDGTGSGDPYGMGEKGGNTFPTFDNSSSHHPQQQQQSGSPNGFPHSTSSHSNLASSGETFHQRYPAWGRHRHALSSFTNSSYFESWIYPGSLLQGNVHVTLPNK